MVQALTTSAFDAGRAIDLRGAPFCDRPYDWYRWMLEDAPACEGRISLFRFGLVARYEDCRQVLTDPRFVRNRGRARGKAAGSPVPFPLPRSARALAVSMILEDDPAHRRLRNLVNKAFTHRAVERLSDRVDALTQETLDALDPRTPCDLLRHYAKPIPTRVIAELMGVTGPDTDRFQRGFETLSQGMSGLSVLSTLLWRLPALTRFVRELIERKRAAPGEDLLSGLIAAEADGDRLNEEELVAMVFLLMVAGFETTQHLISNGVHTLLCHPEQRERLERTPEHWATGIEELVRFRGPVHGTKLFYPTEDVTFHDRTFRRGTPIMPLLGAANHDPRVFDQPDRFDVTRSPNPHLGFGLGMHFCLGKQLALMETRIALTRLLERYPDLHLAVAPDALHHERMPGWHRYTELPIALS